MNVPHRMVVNDLGIVATALHKAGCNIPKKEAMLSTLEELSILVHAIGYRIEVNKLEEE